MSQKSSVAQTVSFVSRVAKAQQYEVNGFVLGETLFSLGDNERNGLDSSKLKQTAPRYLINAMELQAVIEVRPSIICTDKTSRR